MSIPADQHGRFRCAYRSPRQECYNVLLTHRGVWVTMGDAGIDQLEEFWAPRPCFLPPIPELAIVADLLSKAAMPCLLTIEGTQNSRRCLSGRCLLAGQGQGSSRSVLCALCGCRPRCPALPRRHQRHGHLVTTCQSCNYGKGDRLLAELGLIDPRTRPAIFDEWDGLERLVIDRKT